MRSLFVSTLVCAVTGLGLAVTRTFAQEAAPVDTAGAPDETYRVAALHVASASGARYLSAVKAAYTEHSERERVTLDTFEYATERDGVLKLRDLLRNTEPGYDVIICLSVVVVTNFASLYRWEQGRWWWVLFRPRAWLLFSGNVLFALVLIVGFAETGAIRYDNLLAMLAIALGPAAFLRSAVQAMPAGETLDANKVYDDVTRWLTEGTVLNERRIRHRRATYLAYYNRLMDLESEVKTVIAPGLNPTRQKRFTAFQTELGTYTNKLEKKRFCARVLLRSYSWKQLVRRGFIPLRLDKNAADPEVVFRLGVQHCLNNKKRETELDKLVATQLRGLDRDVRHQYGLEYAEMLASQPDHRGRLWVKFQFLWIRFGSVVDATTLRNADLLPKAVSPPWYSWKRWTRVFGGEK